MTVSRPFVLRSLCYLGALLVFGHLAHLNAPLSAAAVLARDNEVSDPYLTRLLDEINSRRKQAGTARLKYVPRRANDALGKFFGKMAPAITWPEPCGHQSVNGGTSWEYMQAAAGYSAEAHGEVLACPQPEPYWTPGMAADIWWNSSVHRAILYDDADVNAVACSVYGGNGGKNDGDAPAQAVLCVTFHT